MKIDNLDNQIEETVRLLKSLENKRYVRDALIAANLDLDLPFEVDRDMEIDCNFPEVELLTINVRYDKKDLFSATLYPKYVQTEYYINWKLLSELIETVPVTRFIHALVKNIFVGSDDTDALNGIVSKEMMEDGTTREEVIRETLTCMANGNLNGVPREKYDPVDLEKCVKFLAKM